MPTSAAYVIAATEVHPSQGDLIVCAGDALGPVVARFPRTHAGKDAADRFIAGELDYQPRYIAYATAHGASPDEMTARDQAAYPGGCMAGFIIWIGQQWSAWHAATGWNPRHAKSQAQHDAFDAWLLSGAAVRAAA